MSRTSTELRPRSLGRFRRALTAVVVSLAVLCGVFFTLGYLQGPKLSSAQVDARAVIDKPGQQLRLFANQPVAQLKAAQVVVTPDAAHTVTTKGDLIAVQFAARLHYGTRYQVRIDGVTSIYQTQSSTISYAFTTASPDLYYLQRGQPNDDIVRTTLAGTDRTVVYSAPRIQDFVRTVGALAVATLAADNTSSLALVSLTDGAVEQVRLPEAGVVQKLGASSTGTMIGFTFTSAGGSITPTYSSTLMFLDLQGARAVAPVTGLDGKPLRALGWELMPDGAGLLALSRERSLFLIDPRTAGAVTPLGQFNDLGLVSGDGAVVTVNDPFGTAALTIADGNQVRLAASSVGNDHSPTYLGLAEPLPTGGRIEKLVIAQPGGKRFSSVLAFDDGTTSTVLYRTPNDAGSIESFSVSPNGQYVAIDTVPDTSKAVTDGYFYDARFTGTETVFVEIATGKVVKSLEGFSLNW